MQQKKLSLLLTVQLLGLAICSSQGAVLGEDCSTEACADQNSHCVSNECVCKSGFTEKDAACVKVIGSACTGTAACSGDVNTICKEDKCECKEDYSDKNDVCTQTVSGTACSSDTKCEIDNAACDTETSKCKCDADFTMNIDKCDPKNAAEMAGLGAIVLSLSVLLACLMMF